MSGPLVTLACMAPSPTQAALLAVERWAWLPGFLDRWYADPLDAADGAEAPAGVPGVLAEWFALVGGRLREVQDSPATPSRLYREGDAVEVWAENQGCWSILAGPGDDPLCVLDEAEYYSFTPAPLSGVLRGMTVSDTLVGAWAEQPGTLGALAPGVRGGLLHEPTDAELAAVTAAYPPLPLVANPFWKEPPSGDAGTVLRHSGWIEWMTADDAAHGRLCEVLGYVPSTEL